MPGMDLGQILLEEMVNTISQRNPWKHNCILCRGSSCTTFPTSEIMLIQGIVQGTKVLEIFGNVNLNVMENYPASHQVALYLG